MSDQFWRRFSTVFGFMAIGVLFGMVVFSSSIEIKDLDLWLHLKVGKFISEHGFVPDVDVLSCTITGKPWVNHEWLFQILVYQVQHAFGFDGLITMQSVVVVLTFFILLLLGYSRDRQGLTTFTLLLVLMVYQTRFTIRPDIFSLLFFAFYIYVLSLHINKRWSLYALCALQVLWTNMHGFFFFGPLLAVIGIMSEFIKRRVPLPYEWNTAGRLTDEEYARLKWIAVVLVLASCINPLTVKGAWYPLGVFFQLGGASKIFFKHIYELQKPITPATLFTTNYGYYKILIFLSALSFVFNRRKVDISSVLVWVVFLLFSLAAIRNLVFFAVAAYLVFTVNMIALPLESLVPLRFSYPKFKHITGVLCKAALIFWMLNFNTQLSCNGYFDFDTYARKSEFGGVSKRNFPYKAVDFLVRHQIKGNFFNDFNSGAYLIGRAYPNIKVFIDGRTEEYGAPFFERYQKIWKYGDAKVFAEFAQKDQITGAFLNSNNQEIPRGVLKMFYGFKDWSIVYFDDDAVIFLKQTPANKPWIGHWAVDLAKWEPKRMDFLRLGTQRVDPFPFTNRAYTLEALGFDEGARKELREALRIAPDDAVAYKLLGRIYGRGGDHRKAFEYFRLAVMFAPHDIENRSNLALAYEHLKDYAGAMNQYQKIIDLAPDNPQGYFGLAKATALSGCIKEALEVLAKARKMSPEDKVDVQKIHDIIDKYKKKKSSPRVIGKR